jgi:hypothetical protein
LAAAFYLAFAVGLAITLSDPSAIAVRITSGLRFVLVLPLVAAVLSVAALLFGFRNHRTGAGRRTSRFFYTLSALFFCTLIWQLSVWNLMGWRF